jgi:hypothetical protein
MDLCYTPVTYKYRDADNYKTTAQCFLEGSVSAIEKARIKKTLNDHEYFIPTQVGLEALQDQLEGFPSEADHVWHTLSFDDPIVDIPNHERVLCSVEAFIARFTKVTFWDVASEARRLGID